MFFLEVLNRIVSIFAGVVGGLNGLITLTEKCKTYIKRNKEQTEKDPSADGSSGDHINDR